MQNLLVNDIFLKARSFYKRVFGGRFMKFIVGILLTSCLGFGFAINNNDNNKKLDASLVEELAPVKETPYAYSSSPSNENKYSYQGISLNHIGNIQSVWDSYRGDGVTIAVIDGGINKAHEDFWVDGSCSISDKSAYFTTDGGVKYVSTDGWGVIEADPTNGDETHGVSTSATAAATISGYGTVGIAPNANILFCKTDFWSNSSMSAVRYAVDNGADVINMSFGSLGGTSAYYQSAIDYAYSKGVIVVASAGNETTTEDNYPSSCNHVVGVGALARDSDYEIASYSNTNGHLSATGHNVDCVAPGTVYTADYHDGTSRYAEVNGTSFSSPIVAGAAALFKQKYPSANQDDFEEALQETCTNIGSEYTFGWGRLNVSALLEYGDSTDVDYQKTGLTTKNEDSTIIEWHDESGWLFRTVHMYNVGFYDGYTYKDFHNFLTISCGDFTKRSSYSMQGTTACWTYNDGSKGDYLINIGCSSSQRDFTFALPWWVIAGTWQFVNNDNWKSNSDCYIWHQDSHYKETMRFYINNGTVYSGTFSSGATYDFPAVQVQRKLLNPDKTLKQTLSVYKTCIYDLLKNDMLTTSSAQIDGYTTSKWYTDSSCTNLFANSFVRFDMTVYAICYESNSTFYFESQDWGNSMYAYEYYFDSQNTLHEPLGTWPGIKLPVFDKVTFRGHGVWYGSAYIPSSGDSYIIFNNGATSQTSDLLLANNTYYLYDTTDESNKHFVGTTDYTNALKLIKDIRDAMQLVEENGNIKKDSICGLSSADVTSFVARANALTGVGKSAFESATVWTYKGTTNENENVSFAAIISQLNNSVGGFYLSHKIGASSDGTIMVLFSFTCLVFIAITALTIRKKQHK